VNDVRIRVAGNLVGLEPVSKQAKDWFDQNLANDSWPWLGRTLYVELRLANDLLTVLEAAGLTAETDSSQLGRHSV
jgi:hypothetical protein